MGIACIRRSAKYGGAIQAKQRGQFRCPFAVRTKLNVIMKSTKSSIANISFSKFEMQILAHYPVDVDCYYMYRNDMLIWIANSSLNRQNAAWQPLILARANPTER